MSEDADTTPQPVKTRVPAYQKAEWVAQAEELGMSLSEFVRTMVQAGRSGFEGVGREDAPAHPNPGGSGLETRLQELLNGSVMSFDEIVDEVSADLEDEVEDVLVELRERGVLVQGPRGDYTRFDEGGREHGE